MAKATARARPVEPERRAPTARVTCRPARLSRQTISMLSSSGGQAEGTDRGADGHAVAEQPAGQSGVGGAAEAAAALEGAGASPMTAATGR